MWAHDEVKELLGDLAEVVVRPLVHFEIVHHSLRTHQRLGSTSRADFLANLQSGGKYAGIVGVYRHNTSADRIGLFDKEIIAALAPSVKWIAHNGAGYDQIDVLECKAKGEPLLAFFICTCAAN